ncbi:MAG: hypothetical protein H6Q31_2098 [Bacteroidetes bacterium]|nr:hypothetical protein [Bacteroidota bacterium]
MTTGLEGFPGQCIPGSVYPGSVYFRVRVFRGPYVLGRAGLPLCETAIRL